MKLITSIDDAVTTIGQELGVSDSLEIDQKRMGDTSSAAAYFGSSDVK